MAVTNQRTSSVGNQLVFGITTFIGIYKNICWKDDIDGEGLMKFYYY